MTKNNISSTDIEHFTDLLFDEYYTDDVDSYIDRCVETANFFNKLGLDPDAVQIFYHCDVRHDNYNVIELYYPLYDSAGYESAMANLRSACYQCWPITDGKKLKSNAYFFRNALIILSRGK